jgi:hypothetical protein
MICQSSTLVDNVQIPRKAFQMHVIIIRSHAHEDSYHRLCKSWSVINDILSLNIWWTQVYCCVMANEAVWHAIESLQVKLTQPTSCLEALFIFSLVWSLGASCDSSSRAKFDKFLRALLSGTVQPGVDRQDYDLGPGVAIKYPEVLLALPLPQVLLGHAGDTPWPC